MKTIDQICSEFNFNYTTNDFQLDFFTSRGLRIFYLTKDYSLVSPSATVFLKFLEFKYYKCQMPTSMTSTYAIELTNDEKLEFVMIYFS